MLAINDEVQQKAEWRTRLVVDLLSQKFDAETLGCMLEAGLRQAHSEGLRDAADICEKVAKSVNGTDRRRTATILGESIKELDRRNKTIPYGDYSCGQPPSI